MFTIYSVILQRESQLLQTQSHIQRIASLPGRIFHKEKFLAVLQMVTFIRAMPCPPHI